MSRTVVAKRGRLLGAIVVLAVGVSAAGCGGSSATVSGKVSYKDQIVKGGSVVFLGANNWTGTSRIAEDGAYSIANVPLGKVQITVETKTAKPNPMMSKMPKPPEGTPLPPGTMYDAAGRKDRYVEIPDNYADKDRSGLTYEVTSGKQVHNIELK